MSEIARLQKSISDLNQTLENVVPRLLSRIDNVEQTYKQDKRQLRNEFSDLRGKNLEEQVRSKLFDWLEMYTLAYEPDNTILPQIEPLWDDRQPRSRWTAVASSLGLPLSEATIVSRCDLLWRVHCPFTIPQSGLLVGEVSTRINARRIGKLIRQVSLLKEAGHRVVPCLFGEHYQEGDREVIGLLKAHPEIQRFALPVRTNELPEWDIPRTWADCLAQSWSLPAKETSAKMVSVSVTDPAPVPNATVQIVYPDGIDLCQETDEKGGCHFLLQRDRRPLTVYVAALHHEGFVTTWNPEATNGVLDISLPTSSLHSVVFKRIGYIPGLGRNHVNEEGRLNVVSGPVLYANDIAINGSPVQPVKCPPDTELSLVDRAGMTTKIRVKAHHGVTLIEYTPIQHESEMDVF